MPDIIDEIDALHAKATPGPLETHGIVGHIEIVSMRSHMAPIVPVARCYSTSCDGPSGAPTFREAMVNADIIVALVNHWPAISARLREAERKAKAWDEIKDNIHPLEGGTGQHEGYVCDSWWHENHPASKAIEAALAAKETP